MSDETDRPDELTDELAKKYGPQFEVPKLLRDMAAKGQSFYGKPAAKAA